jgi:hypothetical protein
MNTSASYSDTVQKNATRLPSGFQYFCDRIQQFLLLEGLGENTNRTGMSGLLQVLETSN